MRVCSFYTNDKYRKLAVRLAKTCKDLDIPHDIREQPDAGSWMANCHRKADFLLNMHYTYPTDIIVWVDADAVVEREPELLALNSYDLAAYRDEGGLIYGGTLGFGTGQVRKMILSAWIRENIDQPERYDQENLTNVVKKMPGPTFRPLPMSYQWVEGWHRKKQPDTTPVISHFIVSRTP